MYVSKNNGFSIECYNIVNTSGATWGMHCNASYNVVPWYSAVDRFEGSEWIFEKVEISDDEMEDMTCCILLKNVVKHQVKI